MLTRQGVEWTIRYWRPQRTAWLIPAPDGCLVALGEAMIRLSPPGRQRLEQASSMEVEVGRAELNALVTFAHLGGRVRWVSRLAATALGCRIQAAALAHRIETVIDWEPAGRTGVYFVERGAIRRSRCKMEVAAWEREPGVLDCGFNPQRLWPRSTNPCPGCILSSSRMML